MKRLILTTIAIIWALTVSAQYTPIDSIADNWAKIPLFEISQKTDSTLIVSSSLFSITYLIDNTKISITTCNKISGECIIEEILIQ